jgi:hypothetical protein
VEITHGQEPEGTRRPIQRKTEQRRKAAPALVPQTNAPNRVTFRVGNGRPYVIEVFYNIVRMYRGSVPFTFQAIQAPRDLTEENVDSLIEAAIEDA